MKLISEEKIKQFAISESDKYESTDEYTNGLMVGIDVGVGLGVSFAETELKNLAIEFTKWKDLNFFESERHLNTPVIYIKYRVAESYKYTLEQLFEKFIEQRNK